VALLDPRIASLEAGQPRPTLFQRAEKLLLPRVFLTAVVIGFALSAVAGRLAVGTNIFDHFVRFHPIIGSETNFNVTALQLQQLLQTIPREKIVVVVGGSSTFHGFGQGPEDVWTRLLQIRLGSRFHVMNLALRGGSCDVFGSHAVEMLIRDGYNVIYVCDDRSRVLYHPAGGQSLYRYFSYDAKSRGLIPEWPLREAAVEHMERDAPERAALRELRLRSTMNAVVSFDDLWTWVAHEYLSLAGWHIYLSGWGFPPRRVYADPQPTLRPGSGYVPARLTADVRNVQQLTTPLFSPEHFAAKVRSINFIPEAVRRRTIIFEVPFSPYFLVHFTDEEQASYDGNNRRNVETWLAAGVPAFDMGRGWSVDDFVDASHFSVAGGRKLADFVAPLIEQRARELAYVK
jgi:hypothetical protein